MNQPEYHQSTDQAEKSTTNCLSLAAGVTNWQLGTSSSICPCFKTTRIAASPLFASIFFSLFVSLCHTSSVGEGQILKIDRRFPAAEPLNEPRLSCFSSSH